MSWAGVYLLLVPAAETALYLSVSYWKRELVWDNVMILACS